MFRTTHFPLPSPRKIQIIFRTQLDSSLTFESDFGIVCPGTRQQTESLHCGKEHFHRRRSTESNFKYKIGMDINTV